MPLWSERSRVARLAALTLISGLLLAALPGCRESQTTRTREPAFPSKAEFQTGAVRVVNPSDRPEAQQKAAEEAPKVISLLNDYYSSGFLDRTKWSNGAHPELAGFFLPDARTQIAPNLGALALAELAPRLKGLRPTRQEAREISFYVEDDLSIPFGVVTAAFSATATPERGKAPVAITHDASFWVIQEGDAYKIYAYSAELKADSQTRAAASGSPRAGSAP